MSDAAQTPESAAPPSTGAPAAAPKPAAPAAPTWKPAPDGLSCKQCSQPLRWGWEGKESVEYVCSTLKDDAPILADKYEEWRNHWVTSRVARKK